MNVYTLASIVLATIGATKMDCSAIKRDALVQDGALCQHLNAECAAKVDLTNIGVLCLRNLPEDVLTNMRSETANQIMSSTLNDVPAEPRLLAALFKKNEWAKHPSDNFLAAAAQSRDYANAIMEGLSSDQPTLARFFSESTADKHFWACSKFTKELVPLVTTSFFNKMKKECFKAIPSDAFEGIDMDRFAALRGELLREISVPQAEKIPTEAFVNMTLDQIKNWGIQYQPPSDADKDAKSTYLSSHPCSQAKRIMNSLKSEYRSNLRAQCKLSDSSAKGKAAFSPVLFAATLAIALAITIF